MLINIYFAFVVFASE